jgi:tetratricopeptide (TPR) repeat protein
MKKITTFFAACVIALFSVANVHGQDLGSATELYNAGATALGQSNYMAALDSFNKALDMLNSMSAEERGDEGASLLKDTKEVLPKLFLRYGKQLASSGDLQNAIEQLTKATELAGKYNVPEVTAEAETLMPQLLLVDASTLYNNGKLEEAIAGFRKVIAVDSLNKDAYLRMGLAYAKTGNEQEALSALEMAAELGETRNAPRQIATIYLKKSAAAVRTKDWDAVYTNAKKANEYGTSSTGQKLVGLAGVQLKKYDEAIEALDGYLASQPNAKDRNSIMYNLATAYEAKGNTAKACGYYKQLTNDPTYKQISEYKIKTQLKCN